MKGEKGSYPIREWPEEDRPREKLLELGPEFLSDAELLAIIIRTGDGRSGRTALDHARQFIAQFKPIRRKWGVCLVLALEERNLEIFFSCRPHGSARGVPVTWPEP
jgi:DNA repair protein RadC